MYFSPEELRFEAYESKSNPTASSQFQQKCRDLENSYLQQRRSLLNPTMEMKETLYKIYKKEPLNAPSNISSSLFGGQQQTSSIFGTPASSANQTNSLFGGSGLSTSVSTSGSSIFGGKPTFGGTSTNLFGSQQPTSTPTAFSSTSSIFGGGNNQSQPKTGIFGSAPATSGGSLFGQPASQNSSTGLIQPSIFGSSSTTQQTQQPTASLFGNPAPAVSTPSSSGGIFGGGSSSSSLFGQPAQFSSPVQSTGGGLFGQPAKPSSNIFGQATTPTTPNANIFGAPSQSSMATSSTLSGNTNLFGQPMQPSASPAVSSTTSSIFGQPSTFGQPVSSSSIFGAATTTMSNSSFASPSTALMTSSEPITSGSQATSSIFATKAPSSPMAGLFGQMGGGETKSDTSKGLFGKTIEKQKDSSIYTPMSELTLEEVEIYKTCKFELGKLPENPPPIELC